MDVSMEKLNVGFDEWNRKLREVHDEIENEEIRLILQQISEINNEDEEVILNEAWNKFNQLTSMQLDEKSVKVVDLISDLICISNNELSTLKLLKTNLKIFHINKNLLKNSENLAYFVKAICLSILKVLDEHNEIRTQKFINFQLIIIIELQKTFQKEEFIGNKYLIKLSIKLIEIDNFTPHFDKIIPNQFNTPDFLRKIFDYENKNEQFWHYCLKITQKLIDMQRDSSNFTRLLIKSIADIFSFLSTNCELYEKLIDGIVQLLSIDSSFEVSEKFLIEEIIGDNFRTSVICFDIMCQLLQVIESIEFIQSYFILFQDIFLNMYHPNIDFSEHKQIRVYQILNLMLQMHNEDLKFFISPDLDGVFTRCRNKTQHDLTSALENVQNSPSLENYYALVRCVKSLKDISDQNQLKDFCHLIQVLSNTCDWYTHVALIKSIVNFITSIDKFDWKMICLLKLNPKSKQINEIPIVIKHDIIKLIGSFNLKTNDDYDGLNIYLQTLLYALLNDDDDCTTKRVYFMKEKNCSIKENDTLIYGVDKLLKTSIDSFPHKCAVKNENDEIMSQESNHIPELENILKFSKELSTQELSKCECEILKEIMINFNKACNI